MNPRDAEDLLRSHRPGRRADGRTQKAVRYAEGHADLRQKLSAQMAFDEQIVDVIHFIQPPENLRQKLSALSAAPRAGQRRFLSHLINPAGLAAAAGVLLIIGVVAFLVIEGLERFPGREGVERMLSTTSTMSGAEFEPVATTAGQLGDWLYMKGYDGYTVHSSLAAFPVAESTVIWQDGKPVALFVARREDTPTLVYGFHANDFGVQLAEGADWRLLTQDAWVAAIRQHGGHCSMIAFQGGREEMRAFLQSLARP